MELFNLDNKYKMPESYKGEVMKNGGLTTHPPRRWTEKEIEWVGMLVNKGFSIKQIANCIDRDYTQVSIKLKRLKKKNMTYNESHKSDKYDANEKFLAKIAPSSVLDVYAGLSSFYHRHDIKRVVSNDKNPKSETDYHLDALDFVCKMYYDGGKYDLVDLDPFGSAYDCFDLCIKMAKKGIIITLGEMGHKRFKRLDYVRRYYGIETLEDFNTESLISHIIKIGERNKKSLNPQIIKEWKGISRVYFEISPLKITEQWDSQL